MSAAYVAHASVGAEHDEVLAGDAEDGACRERQRQAWQTRRGTEIELRQQGGARKEARAVRRAQRARAIIGNLRFARVTLGKEEVTHRHC